MKQVMIIGGIFVAVVLAISLFLAPNDLFSCEGAPTQTDGCGPVDAIVAVSGGDTSARTQEAIRLYKAGWSKQLIFSGAAQDKSGPSNAEAMKKEAVKLGVDESAIILEEYGENTKQNAEKTANIFESKGIKSAILVTSGYHQKRTSLEFHRRAPSVDVKSYPVKSDKHWSMLWWLSPGGWYLAISELTKIVLFYAGASG